MKFYSLSFAGTFIDRNLLFTFNFCYFRVEKYFCWTLNKFSLLPALPLFATSIDKPECRKCAKALQELENIDDEADQLGIGFVKIHDETLADEYNLGELPRLVYYRHKTPIIYESMTLRVPRISLSSR